MKDITSNAVIRDMLELESKLNEIGNTTSLQLAKLTYLYFYVPMLYLLFAALGIQIIL